MAVSDRRTCTKCSQSFPIDHFRGRANRSCRHCASCRNVPTEGLSSPFSPVQPPIPLAITSPVVAASASTTHALEPSAPPAPSTTLAGASPLAVPLQPLPYLTEASPAFLRLQQQLDDQGSSLSGISNALQQLLASSRPQPPTAPLPSTPQRAPAAPSLLAPTDSTSATGCHHLGAPSPGESDTNRIFSWLSREVVQQVLDDSLAPQDLGKLRNPDSLPVDSEDNNAVFVNGVLIRAAPSSGSSSSTRSFLRLVPDVRCFAEAWTVYTHLRSCATNDPNLGAGLGAFLIHIIETDRTHTWSSVALYILTTCRRRFGHASAAVWAQQDQNAWNQHLSTAASFRQPKKTTQQPPSNRLTQQQQQQPQQQPQGPPSKRQKSAEVCFRFNGGGCPEGDNCWRRHECTACSERHPVRDYLPALPRRERGSRTPPLQGSARHLDGQTGLLAPRPPPLQGLARLSPDPAGSTSSRTPPLQGSARPLDSVPAALDVPSADRCLSLLLAAWLRDPGPRPNTSFVADVFDPTTNPARQGSMQERSQAWSTLLHLYPDPVFRRQLLGMVQHGCLLGYDGPLRGADRHCANLPIPPAGHSHLRMEIDARLAEGRLSIMAPGTALVESPIGVVPKPRSTKLRTIHHLSHPRRPLPDVLPSVNSGIQPGFIQIRYEGLGDLLTFVSQHPGCLLWKGDLEDAFRHVVTAEPDAHLLGFSYEGIRYRENALTFGGSSSPWLFNLVAEFLHWLVAACLPTGWPVNHYLDDTFGAVPASAAELALLPIHTLALAANTLGLRLSPKKTFGGVTKLEILGVEIDSVAQTVSISNIRCARILLQCQGLLQRRSADLLDMQRIAGLLQFVSQVFPCGRAFLRRLYDATRRGSQGRRRLSQPVRAELSWWCQILQSWSGTSVLAPSPLLATHIWTDACPKGYGGFVGDASSPSAVFARQVPKRHRRKNIRFLEALAVLEALRRFVHLLPASSLVVVHVDNENVEHGLRSGRSRDPLSQRLLREIFGFCFTHNLTLAPQRVSSTDNVLADLLSRRQFSRIQQQFPRAHAALSFPLAPAQSCRNPLVLPPASASPTTPRPSSGTASPSAPGDVRAAHPPISEPSASAITLLEWLAHMSASGRPFHSAKHELGALRSYHVDLGLDTSGFSCGRLERALRGFKRLHGVGGTGAKLPITLPLLRRILIAIESMLDLLPRDRLVLQASFALAFACFLRSGELVWDSSTDRATVLSVASVAWASDHVVITLPSSKTDPFRQGVRVVAPEVGGVECPVHRLRALTAGRPASSPLFGLGPHGTEPLSRSVFVGVLRRAVQASGLQASQYAGHSFRRGAATWASQHGASTSDIQSMGRWSSDCYRRYIERSAHERRTLVATSLFAVRDGPLVPASPAWRDPGSA
ncbi:uncharacterized protein UTRI_10008 [Ustilago trichophora]|uniref:C3H1-type domain-containing protein n=1 Tax=Ustilago trichophora TaxID=86804 RepID=A0A5C3DR47_9BASI|nr:uncharacterized protein UTRI_10008 [Ustilago trichophora]